MPIDDAVTSPRRGFLASLAALGGSMRMGFGGPARQDDLHEHDRWLAPLTGKHRQVYDVVSPSPGAIGLSYALNFLYAHNDAYKIPDSDLSVVVVLRDKAATLALNDAIWEKYKLGEAFSVTDPTTQAPALRNLHARRGSEPAHLSATIEALQARGVKVAACAMALRAYAGQTARRVGVPSDVVRGEWIAGLLPGIVSVPAGVVAVNRAQGRGFSYVYAG